MLKEEFENATKLPRVGPCLSTAGHLKEPRLTTREEPCDCGGQISALLPTLFPLQIEFSLSRLLPHATRAFPPRILCTLKAAGYSRSPWRTDNCTLKTVQFSWAMAVNHGRGRTEGRGRRRKQQTPPVLCLANCRSLRRRRWRKWRHWAPYWEWRRGGGKSLLKERNRFFCGWWGVQCTSFIRSLQLRCERPTFIRRNKARHADKFWKHKRVHLKC